MQVGDPEKKTFTRFEIVDFLNQRRVRIVGLDEALGILIGEKLIRQVDVDTFQPLVEVESKTDALQKVLDARTEILGFLVCLMNFAKELLCRS